MNIAGKWMVIKIKSSAALDRVEFSMKYICSVSSNTHLQGHFQWLYVSNYSPVLLSISQLRIVSFQTTMVSDPSIGSTETRRLSPEDVTDFSGRTGHPTPAQEKERKRSIPV